MAKEPEDNQNTGFISIYRSITKHWLFPKNKPLTYFEAWITILLEVNYSDQKVNIGYEVFECKRGESLNSLDTWARLFNWNKSKVRRFFKMLQNDSMIILNNEQKTTRLTVCKYEDYQGTRNKSETKVKRKRHASETQTTPNNKDNKDNKENNIPSFENFKEHALSKKPLVNLGALKNKYDSWVENGWRDGNNKEIKNWKSKLSNTLTYIPEYDKSHFINHGNDLTSKNNSTYSDMMKKDWERR